jgi:fibronectin type 3 domain-containing protein
LLSLFAVADLNIVDDVLTYSTLSSTTVNMSSVSELHITSSTSPLTSCIVNLNSADSFLFLEGIKPSAAASTYLSQVRVSGAAAVLDTNVRVVEYAAGAVIIPQSSTFQPLQVFIGENFTESSAYLGQYTAYNTSLLGSMASSISSFILKRGYTATFAQNENGTGYSKNYVAQDCDLEIGVLPDKLNDQINFVRVFPWRWVSKKGIAGNIGSNLNIAWSYNWNIDQNSTLDKEYVPIRQTRWWPGLGQDWQARGSSHLLGYNEPDSTSQSNILVGDAIWSWPDLLGTGLRVGSPAPTDGGRSSWLYPFIQQADAADLRVDFVAVHYYWCYDPANPSGAATQMYNFLNDVHNQTGRPIWITEWNNGANWTGCGDPTYAQQAAAVAAMVAMLDSTPWVERYALYNWVEDVRRVEWDDGSLTDAGVVYRDEVSPIGYRQEVPGSGKSANAMYYFDDNFRDCSGNGNNPLVYGAPKRAAGQISNALVLDGINDCLVLPTNMGKCTDFTFGAWIYWNGGNNWQRIFDFGNDINQYMFLSPSSGSSTLRFAIKNGGSEQIVQTSQLVTGQWVHVAITLEGDLATLYVNGVSAATNNAITINPSSFNPTVNYIGKSQFSADPLFAGKIDELYLADHALSGTQIVDLMNDNLNELPLLSQSMPVTASSYQTGNIPANGNDGDTATTRWTAVDAAYPQWWRVDLGSIQTINMAVIYWYGDTARSYKYRLETSNDDINYTTLVDQTSRTATGTSTDTFNASARYVRVTVTGTSTGWAAFYECRIYGAAGSPSVPSTPTGLSASSVSSSQINLSWNASSGATSYNVKRSAASGGPYTTIDSPTGTSYSNTGLSASTTYYYVVSAVNANGESSNSTQASATTQDQQDTTPPAAPTGLAATAGDATVSLDWANNSESDLAGYNVYRATSSGGYGSALVSGLTSSSYTDNAVTNGTTYYYIVTAVDTSSNESPDSAEASAAPTASCSPTAITPYLQIDGGSWQLASDVTLNAGQSIILGPQPVSGGSWSWSGPNGFSSAIREVTLSNVTVANSGAYVATYTNDCGAQSQQTFNITVNSALTTLLEDGFETSFDKWTDGGTTDWDRATSQKYSGSYSAHAGSSDNDLFSDNLNTTGYSSITIDFWFMDDDIDNTDNIYLQLYNGSSYVNFYELGNSTEDTWNHYTVTLTSSQYSQYFRSNFRIKFEGSSIDTGENLWIDDVLITAQ